MSKTGITLNLENVDGNAFFILGVCRRALQRAGKIDRWPEFHAEATAGDYNHLLFTVSDWFNVVFGDEPDEDGGEDYDEDEN